MARIKQRLNAAIEWRLRVFKNFTDKIYWKFRILANFSKKEHVKGVAVVVVGRNDNYGGDFSERLQTTLDWNLKHIPNPELIYIEWNQISGRHSDCEWISKRYLNSKCFVVPKSIHDTITNNPKMPVMEYFAKNIGIRNASYDWLLLINADVFLALDTIKNLSFLSKKYVYGTHYINIKWDSTPIDDKLLNNKSLVLNSFSANKNMDGVVGNFILTHKDNWKKATGYDEQLINVRDGVDTNGLNQLYFHGLKPMVIGHHFHLDHKESLIHGVNPTHGSHAFDNIPYNNNQNWGFLNYSLKQINERIWELEKT